MRFLMLLWRALLVWAFFAGSAAGQTVPEVEKGQASLRALSVASDEFRAAVDADRKLDELKKKLVLYPGQNILASAQLNENKPTHLEKLSLLRFIDIAQPSYEKQVAALKTGFPISVYSTADSALSAVKQVYIELYKGRINYGDANSKILELYKNGIQALNQEVAKYGQAVQDAYTRKKEEENRRQAELARQKADEREQQQLISQRQQQQEQQLRIARCQNAIARVKVVCKTDSRPSTNITINNGPEGMGGMNSGWVLPQVFDESSYLPSSVCLDAQRTAKNLCE